MKMKFFEKARDASRLSDHAKYFLGSVVVYKNRIIGVG